MTDPVVKTRDRVMRRVSALETRRSSWLSDWQDINRVLVPRRGDLYGNQSNQGSQRNTDILDNTGTMALATLQSGMLSGMTSPARPWLKIETADTELMESKSVSLWCDQVTQQLRTIFSRSNTYQTLHGMYGALGAYGTAVSLLEKDYNDVIRFTPLAMGKYALSLDGRGEVNGVSIRKCMTVEEVVDKYVRPLGYSEDWSKVSQAVKNLWDRGERDAPVNVTQLIQPRKERDSAYADARNMPFESICIEDGAEGDKVLWESGYRQFPGVAMRWYVEAQDVYGTNCPGMVALGDIQQLQVEQAKKSKAIDFMADPPLQAPIEMKNQESDLLPGGLSYVSMTGPHSAIRTAFDVQLNLQHLLLDLQDVRQRINSAFYADLFLFLSNIQGLKGQMTAREVAEIHEEKLLMLGPVVERTEGALARMVERAFEEANEARILPPPPPEAQGQSLKVEFIGLLSQAQRAVSMASVDRIIGAAGSIAAAKQDPSVWDTIDTDIVISKAGAYLGVDPEILRGKEEIEVIRQQRAQAMQQQAQAEAAERASATAKNLAGANMDGNNALSNIVRGFAGGVPGMQ